MLQLSKLSVSRLSSPAKISFLKINILIENHLRSANTSKQWCDFHPESVCWGFSIRQTRCPQESWFGCIPSPNDEESLQQHQKLVWRKFNSPKICNSSLTFWWFAGCCETNPAWSGWWMAWTRRCQRNEPDCEKCLEQRHTSQSQATPCSENRKWRYLMEYSASYSLESGNCVAREVGIDRLEVLLNDGHVCSSKMRIIAVHDNLQQIRFLKNRLLILTLLQLISSMSQWQSSSFPEVS